MHSGCWPLVFLLCCFSAGGLHWPHVDSLDGLWWGAWGTLGLPRRGAKRIMGRFLEGIRRNGYPRWWCAFKYVLSPLFKIVGWGSRHLRMSHTGLYWFQRRASLWYGSVGISDEIYRGLAGKLRSIGVSNFEVAHLQRLLSFAIKPVSVVQNFFDPFFQDRETREFCARMNIHYIGYRCVISSLVIVNTLIWSPTTYHPHTNHIQ